MPLVLLSVLLHLYIGSRIVSAFPGAGMASLLVLLLVASAFFVPVGLFARRISRPPASDTLAWIGLLFLGLFSSLFVLTVLRDIALLCLWLFGMVAPAPLPVAAISAGTAAAVPLLGLGITLLGFLNARRIAPAKHVDIPLEGLPAALEGFRIAQISDIHVGPTIKGPYLRRIVDAVNALDADVIAITGDLVDGSVDELEQHVAPLALLEAKHGVYFVTGNHEYYSGVEPWLAHLRSMGIRVLMNEHVVVARGGAQLVVAGVPDYSAGHFDPSHRPDAAAALAGAPQGAPRILLAHQPRSAPSAVQAGFDLQLSGHTHGGQFLPWNFFVPLQQPYTAGLHRLGRLWLYVSRGTGYWGPPKRFGAPSEITELKLIRTNRPAM